MMWTLHTGIPVAWAIVDREDITSYRVFIKAVKGRVPTAEVTCVMTDDGMHSLSRIKMMCITIM